MANTNKEESIAQTMQTKITQIGTTALISFIYIVLGVYLCYLKIIFGDLCRKGVSHQDFMEKEKPVDSITTTPSLPYYSREDDTYYTKQLFTPDPNFIMTYAQNENNYKNKWNENMLKTWFLETSYVIYSIVMVLEDIPNWVLLLFGFFIWMFIMFAVSVFMWIMLSYYIFIVFEKPGNFFSNHNIGWLGGLIAWYVLMILGGWFTVPIAVCYGLYRLILTISKTQVRSLKATGTISANMTDVGDDASDPYGFYHYFTDTVKSSFTMHLMLLYVLYKIMNSLNKSVATALIILSILVIFIRQKVIFISKEELNPTGWTTFLDSVTIAKNIASTVATAIATPVAEVEKGEKGDTGKMIDTGKEVVNPMQTATEPEKPSA